MQCSAQVDAEEAETLSANNFSARTPPGEMMSSLESSFQGESGNMSDFEKGVREGSAFAHCCTVPTPDSAVRGNVFFTPLSPGEAKLVSNDAETEFGNCNIAPTEIGYINVARNNKSSIVASIIATEDFYQSGSHGYDMKVAPNIATINIATQNTHVCQNAQNCKTNEDVTINIPEIATEAQKSDKILQDLSHENVRHNSNEIEMENNVAGNIATHDVAVSNDVIDQNVHKRKSKTDLYMKNCNNATEDQKMETNDKSKNPKILILDFVNYKEVYFSEIRKVLLEKTSIRSYKMKLLANKGISILFSNERAKKLAEELLLERFDSQLKKKKSFNDKKFFEIECRLPEYILPEHVVNAINASHYVRRKYGSVIFFMPSLNSAAKIIENGALVKNTFLEFKLFVFSPKLQSCLNCGSVAHSNCSLSALDKEHLICVHCHSEEHSSESCPVLKAKIQDAKSRKKQTYAEALKGQAATRKIVPPPPITNAKLRLLTSRKATETSSADSLSSTTTPIASKSTDVSLPLNIENLIIKIVSVIFNHLKLPGNEKEITSIVLNSLNNNSNTPLEPKPTEFVNREPVPAIKSILKKPKKPSPLKERSSRYSKVIASLPKKSIVRKRDDEPMSDNDANDTGYDSSYDDFLEELQNLRRKKRVSFSGKVIPTGHYYAKCACGFVLFEQSGFLEHFTNSSDTSKCSMLCRCEGTFLYDETIGSLSAAAFAEHVESDCKL